MGVRDIFKTDPVKLAYKAVQDQGERVRREAAKRRIDLYQDNCEPWLNKEIDKVFRVPEVRARVKAFARLSCSNSLFKRVVDEISRPVYSRPPLRKISSTGQKPFALLSREVRIDQKMDRAVRLAHAANAVFLHDRYSSRLQRVIREMWTPDMVTVIPDPDDPTLGAAYIVDAHALIKGEQKKIHIFWDDHETFKFNTDGDLLKGSAPSEHNYERIPVVPIHRVERWGGYWDTMSGTDLENGQLAVMLLTALVLKLHKSQGEKQPLFKGDTGGLSKDQVIDGESPWVAPEGVDMSLLDLRSDARHYTDTIEKMTTWIGANHGLNRERLNARTTSPADDTSLTEKRDDIIKVFVDAEHQSFDMLKMVSQHHDDPAKRIPETAELKRVDFGEIEERYDMKTRLEVWDLLEARGLRSPIDSVRALNAEIRNEAEAKAEIIENMTWRAWIVGQQRDLNAPQDRAKNGAGLTPQENGATGPMIRDGRVTPNQLDEIQKRGRAGETNAG